MFKRFALLFFCLTLALTLAAAQESAPQLHGYQGAWQYVRFGSYPTPTDGVEGEVVWRVIEVKDDEALLLSDKVLDALPAAADLNEFVDFPSSALNKWLQNDFAAALLGAGSERAALKDGDALGLPTSDLIKNKELGFKNEKSRAAKLLSYVTENFKDQRGAYWLSTPASANRYSLRVCKPNGSIGHAAVTKEMGIRPTLRIDPRVVTITGGSGTPGDPFDLTVTADTLARLEKERQEAEELARLKEEAEIKARKEKEEKLAREKAELEQALSDAEKALSDAKAAGRDANTLAALEKSAADAMKAVKLAGGMDVPGFPHLTGEGFLPEGEPEFVFQDPENGVWRYCSEDLRIEITRHSDVKEKNRKVRWLQAEVFSREGAEGFRMLPFNAEHRTENRDLFKSKQNLIARKHGSVFAMGGDYYLFRTGRPGVRVGLIIRDGQVLFDDAPKKPKTNYPPLDLMALYPDGGMRLFAHGETNAEELLKSGARDVLSFGPWLIRNGEINMEYTNYGYHFEPRVGMGIVEKGHYWCVVMEGRTPVSRGWQCRETAYLLKDLGCVDAYNLDGGWTSCMMFMGNQINQLDKTGVHNNARTQNEILAIGHSDNLPAYALPDQNK